MKIGFQSKNSREYVTRDTEKGLKVHKTPFLLEQKGKYLIEIKLAPFF